MFFVCRYLLYLHPCQMSSILQCPSFRCLLNTRQISAAQVSSSGFPRRADSRVLGWAGPSHRVEMDMAMRAARLGWRSETCRNWFVCIHELRYINHLDRQLLLLHRILILPFLSILSAAASPLLKDRIFYQVTKTLRI